MMLKLVPSRSSKDRFVSSNVTFIPININSRTTFSLQERKVIIISTVRSSKDLVKFDLHHTLGFVANPRRFNGMI